MSNLFEQMGAFIQPDLVPTNNEVEFNEYEQEFYQKSLVCQALKEPEKIDIEMKNLQNRIYATLRVKGTCFEITLDALNKRLSQLDNAKFEAHLIKKILGV